MADLFDELESDTQQQKRQAVQRGGDLFSELEPPPQVQEAPPVAQVQEQQDPSFLSGIADMFTGESRTTPEIDEAQEIGVAPELNEFSFRSLRASAGLLATGDTEKLKGIIKTQVPEATFKADEKGNVMAVLPSGTYALNKPGLTGADLARGIFQFAAFTPAAKLAAIPKEIGKRVGTAAAGSAATEAGLQAGAQAVGGGDIKTGDVVLAGALGAGGQALGEGISAAARGIKGQISPQAQQVIQAGEREGVQVATTDILPPKNIVGGLARQLGERIPVFGTGGKRAIQQESRERASKEFIEQMAPLDHFAIVESLQKQTSKVKKAAGGRIQNTIDDMTGFGSVPLSNTNKAIDAAIDRLQSAKIAPDEKTIAELQSIKAGAKFDHDFRLLRDARTSVRELAEMTDPLGKSQLPSKSKAAIESVRAAMTRDLDNFVEANSPTGTLSRYKKADLIYANEAQKLTKSRLKNVLDKGDLTPETVETVLFSRKPSEVRLLHDSLTAEGKQAARSALIARAAQKATREDDFSVNVFASELTKLKDNTGVFFKGDEAKKLNGLRKLLNATRRSQDASIVTPTGQSLIGLTAAGAGAQVGLWPTLAAAATGGGAARVYESAAMRNFLLRLADTPINSTGFDRLVRTTTPKINALLQSVRQEEQNQ